MRWQTARRGGRSSVTDGRVYIGFDPNEMQAYNVAERSARANASIRLDIKRLALINLKNRHLYHRPTERREGQLWDVISDAPMSTEHAISRFFVPMLCEYHGWAVFMDGDVLVRGDMAELFALANPTYAVQVVQHPHRQQGAIAKKAGQIQTQYLRKNWSSVVLWNTEHPAHRFLTTHSLNTLPGRDLHRFCWLADHEIGALPPEWNHLVGVSPAPPKVKLAHFTLGTPNIAGHEEDDFAHEWKGYAKRCGYQQAVAVGR